MPSLLAKSLIAIIIATTISGSAALISRKLALKEIPITELLQKDSKTLLTSRDNDDIWKRAWQAFIDAHNNKASPNGIWSVDSWETTKNDRNTVPQKFKNNCSTNGSKKVKDRNDPLYVAVLSYCTK
ncbi:hypothetical protein A6V39_01155 [Candidatus Mycoplasma haematobovis]|uniref:Uncharacterized protein n=1 Tax=Candidatus Mycoplasma haematobovis TaxID=432608 RepID=A0A1A9QF71_9MOLU|nr:hypothetical protein [Candidatus Mycoplasma haematobovis]OAL10661.1 hypothetical protein A6V39_01155 [Candidatus Mycoplasma haematobovis]